MKDFLNITAIILVIIAFLYKFYLFKTNYKSASLALGLTYGLPNYTAYTGYAESHCANHINADAL